MRREAPNAANNEEKVFIGVLYYKTMSLDLLTELRIDGHGNLTIRFGEKEGRIISARSIGEPVIIPDYDSMGAVRAPLEIAKYLPKEANAFVLGQNSRMSLNLGRQELSAYAVQFYRIEHIN